MEGSRELGDAIYQERVRRGLSQQGAALLLGTSQPTFNRWESARGLPRDREHFRRLADFLNMPTLDVLALAFIERGLSEAEVEERVVEVERLIGQAEREMRGADGQN